MEMGDAVLGCSRYGDDVRECSCIEELKYAT